MNALAASPCNVGIIFTGVAYDEYKNSVFHSKDETYASIVHTFSLSLQKISELWQRIY